MTMPTGAAPQRGTLQDTVQSLIDRGYDRQILPVLRAVESTVQGEGTLVQRRLEQLEERATELEANGESFSEDDPVLRAFFADYEDAIRGTRATIEGAGEGIQQAGAEAAGTMQRQLALPGFTDAQLQAVGIRWNQPDPEAINQALNYAGSGAWRDKLLEEYQALVVDKIRDTAIGGIVRGYGPRRVASLIRNVAPNLPVYQANNLARTLQLTSLRDAGAVHQNANIGLARRVIRVETLDDRTCLSCISFHGEVMWDSEDNTGEPIPRVNDHHQGRGTSVMQVRGRQLNIQRGEDWFAGLSVSRQRQQNSFQQTPAKYEAYRRGAVSLRDFRQDYEDDTFGEMVREASLKGVLGADANQYYQSNQ